MKQTTLFICILLVLTSSCKKDISRENKTENISLSILGKWLLEKQTEDEYRPDNQLLSHNETAGEMGDSLIFKSNNKVYIYSDTNGNGVLNYTLNRDNTILFETELWKIISLTPGNFILESIEMDPSDHSKNIVRTYLKRF